MTLRLPPELAADLRMVAEIEGTAISEQARAALAEWVAQRRADPGFQNRLRERVVRDQRLLDRLRGGEDDRG